MKFPITALNVDEFNQTISTLLEDPDCTIFLDTNILALVYKLHATAREEFFGWITPFIERGRIKIPVWALSEYTNRFIRSKTSDYISTLNKLKTFNKEFKEIKQFLEMNIDSKSLHRTSYATREAYLADLSTVTGNLEKLSNATKDKSLDYILEVHDQIVEKFESTIMSSDIFKIIDDIELKGTSRFKNQIPPGFQDGGKGLNSFGDLIIWTEILTYYEDKEQKKTIILTNDGKKDWIYAPKRIIQNQRKSSNTNDFYKIIDTRLVYEYQTNTGSDDVHIINFDTLINLLINKEGKNLQILARAIQIINEQDEESASTLETEGTDTLVTPSSAPINDSTQPENTNDGVEDTQVNEPAHSDGSNAHTLLYSTTAKADATLQLDDQEPLSNYILGLKSYNWYSQNNQIDQIKASLSVHLHDTQEVKDKLFVLGRNIYQAASGGAFRAMDFMENLLSDPSMFDTATANHLYSGMFYEVYFNANGEFRNGKYKGAFYELLFEHQTDDKFKPSIEFINGVLSPHSEQLLVLPSIRPQDLTVHVSYEIKERDEFEGKVNDVTSIRAREKELLNSREDGHFFHSIMEKRHEFEEIINHAFLIPSKQARFIYIPESSESSWFHISSIKELKLTVST